MNLPVRISRWLTLAAMGGCSPSGPGAVTPEGPPRPPPAQNAAPPPEVVRLPGGSVGPFLMPVAQGWLAAWAAPDVQGDTMNWYSATFGDDGRPRVHPRLLMEAPSGLSTLRVRALDAQRGLVVGAFEVEDSEADDPAYGLTTLAVSSAGTMLAGAATLVEDCNSIVWIEVIPLAKGALITWAENLGDRADVFGVIVNADGHRQTDLFHLHDNARAWQVVKHAQGAMLGVVTMDGNVDVVSFAADGTPRPPQILLDGHTAQADLDLAATKDRVLVAFSDRRGLEPQLYSAWVSLDGNLRTDPKPMTTAYGAATLIGLRATADRPAALWQNTTHEPDLVRLARVDGEGRLTGASLPIPLPPQPTEVTPRDVLLPQLEATSAGLVVMEPPCADTRTCPEHSDVLELTAELAPKTRLTWPNRSNASLVWDFQCGAVNCAALSANFGQRPTIELLTTAAATRTKINRRKTAVDGRFRGSLQAVARTLELAALAVTPAGEGTLVASLSAFDPNTPYEVPSTPAPDGRLAPVQAQLNTHFFGPSTPGRSPAPEVETSISIRARSVAGVEMVPSGDQTLLVWTALDDQKPQVFVTLLDSQGRKVRQNMLTRQSGEILALAAARGPDGFLYVGWVREQGETNLVYVARLNNVVGRQSADTLVAQTKGSISSLDLAVTSLGVTVVLAENLAGTETLKWLSLQSTTLLPKPTPISPLAAQSAHTSFAPRLENWGDGLAFAWLEHDGETYRVKLQRLTRSGEISSTITFPVPGDPSTLNLRCTDACRIVVTGEQDDNRGYVAVSTAPADADQRFTPTVDVVAQHLSPAGAQVRAGLSHRDVYFFDTSADGERHLLHKARPDGD